MPAGSAARVLIVRGGSAQVAVLDAGAARTLVLVRRGPADADADADGGAKESAPWLPPLEAASPLWASLASLTALWDQVAAEVELVAVRQRRGPRRKKT
jgi:hypothetical protein